jgi:curved DNA-binding protein CbpA
VHRKSILRAVDIDRKKPPIGALEAFVLSQVQQARHGEAVAEEVAELTGLEIAELLRIARHLVEVGALAVDGEKRRTKHPTVAPAKPRATVHPAHGKRGESLVPPAVVPAQRKHGDLRSLGIGPREGFLLSQIDGATSVADLGEITGLSARDLSVALRTLEATGAVDLGPGKRRRSTVAPQAARRSVTPAPAPAPAPTPESETCDLPEAERASITQTLARVESLDLYGVLGVERGADPKAIRRAYHALAPQFHPDRFFRKKLGPFRRPLERIFMRLTLAYDTLSKTPQRAAYDATLPAPAAKKSATHKPPKHPTQKVARHGTQKPPKNATHRPPKHPTVKPARPEPRAPTVKPPAVPAPVAAAPAPGSDADPLRRIYLERERRNVDEHLQVFVRAAKEAIERDDLVAAANHYRLAVQCSSDPALRTALEEVDARARKRVLETSLTTARAAEQAGRWSEAGARYAKAYGVRAEAWVAERAANALRLDGADLRAAARFAEQAVLAEPNNAAYRVTLGEVYFDAGLLARAAGEASRAVALAPADLRAIALAKQVAKAKRA